MDRVIEFAALAAYLTAVYAALRRLDQLEGRRRIDRYRTRAAALRPLTRRTL